MKKVFKFFGICAIMLFSFYYTEKIALYAQSQSPIMQSINEAKDNLAVASINAEVKNDYIIPGINGLSVNTKKSFNNMKSFNAFNSYYLVFDQVPPDISLENNKQKIIKQGNKLKRSIALILEDNKAIYNYLKTNGVKANVLLTLENYSKEERFEIINNDTNEFNEFDALLNKAEINKKLCLVNQNIIDYCLTKDYYLIENTKELNSSNIAVIKRNIESGDIILIKASANLEDFKLLFNQIKYQDLNIVYLSELITEENN